MLDRYTLTLLAATAALLGACHDPETEAPAPTPPPGPANVAPTITTQPASQPWDAAGVTFSVAAGGTPVPTLAWAADGSTLGASGRYAQGACSFDYSGGTSGTLVLTQVAGPCAGTAFTASAENAAGRATSNGATLIATTAIGTAAAGLAGTPGSADGSGSAARFSTPNYVAVAPDGRIAVGDFANSTIRIVTPAGAVTTLAGSPGVFGHADGSGSAALFAGSGGLAFDGAGNLFVADWDNHVIRRVTAAGVVSTLAGSPGIPGSADGTGSAARFSNPNGLAVDPAGNVYVADWGNHTIRRITPAGEVSTLAGSAGQPGSADGSGAAARFHLPSGLAIDGSGHLVVADQLNHTLRRITPAGSVSTLAGSAGSAGTANGSPADARFTNPAWVTATADGTVFVVEAAGDAVRRITPAGVVSTVAGVTGDSAALRLGADPRLRAARGVWAVSANDLVIAADQSIVRLTLP